MALTKEQEALARGGRQSVEEMLHTLAAVRGPGVALLAELAIFSAEIADLTAMLMRVRSDQQGPLVEAHELISTRALEAAARRLQLTGEEIEEALATARRVVDRIDAVKREILGK